MTTRNGHSERLHWGSVAVVDAAGTLLAYAGDCEAQTFSRSTLKPFQALPFVAAGGAEHFGFTDSEIALMCASHSGEDIHVQTASSMLTKIGMEAADLRCGVQIPLHFGKERLPPAGSLFDQLHHNCSGKHVGFLAFCHLCGEDPLRYLEESSELQRAVEAQVAILAGVSRHAMWRGIDGCSAPNWGFPLSRLALLWARLAGAASGTAASDAGLARIYTAMQAHPEMVSGQGRFDLELTKVLDGDGVAKVGADGLFTVAIRSKGMGVAVRIADGSADAAYAVAAWALVQLGIPLDVERGPISRWARPVLRNVNGIETGRLAVVGELQWA